MATRGPKPAAGETKEARGTERADRGNARVADGLAPLGPPPEAWSWEEKEYWWEVEALAPRGVLTHCDRALVELTARLMAQMRSEGHVTAALATQLRHCLAELGATPAARARVGGQSANEAGNAFARNGTRNR